LSGRNTMPPQAALDWFPCVPAWTQQRTNTFMPAMGRRGHGISRWNVSVFTGTPPAKPLDCHCGRGMVRLAHGWRGG
jgi:hypothetical protein